jgi:hypothetical protein
LGHSHSDDPFRAAHRGHSAGHPRLSVGSERPRRGRFGRSTFQFAKSATRDQDLTGQIEALKAAGAKTIYREKVSGARADRPQLAKLMAKLGDGDVVVVTKIDRLGRSTRELLDERTGKSRSVILEPW